MTDARRALPGVDRLLGDPAVAALLARAPRSLVVAATRAVLARARATGELPADGWPAAVAREVEAVTHPALRPVLNATGVVIHTNLGRAPLAREAIEAIREAAEGYTALEYDLEAAGRGERGAGVRRVLAETTGAEDALVVNNAAGALVLALNALAQGREVVLSRGELIEIGGSFRIPEILEQSGARLREVGTTNRTHLSDYARAIGPATAAILTVHRSNFSQRGFVATPDPKDLAALARERGIPYLHDVGSGLLADLSPWGLTGEPRVPEAVAAGAELVIFSGDKLLGGPQAGCLVGRAGAVARCRSNPLARALRADKFTLAALEATLALYRDARTAIARIPVLRMLALDSETLRERAERLAALIPASLHPDILPGESMVGGGAFPDAPLPTWLVALAPEDLGVEEFAARLRAGDPPLVTRVAQDRVVLDPRTLPEDALPAVARVLAQATGPDAA
jgi:L-seryl-tRNA(Ser) seleniumtransferase